MFRPLWDLFRFPTMREADGRVDQLARQVARQVCRTIQGEDFWAKKWREMFESFANMPWLFLMFESLTFSINCICAQKCQAVWFLDLSHWAMLNGVWCMACLYIFGETQAVQRRLGWSEQENALLQKSRACSWVDLTYATWIQSCNMWLFSWLCSSYS